MIICNFFVFNVRFCLSIVVEISLLNRKIMRVFDTSRIQKKINSVVVYCQMRSQNYKKEIIYFDYCADQPPSTGIAVPVLNKNGS